MSWGTVLLLVLAAFAAGVVWGSSSAEAVIRWAWGGPFQVVLHPGRVRLYEVKDTRKLVSICSPSLLGALRMHYKRRDPL